MICFKNAQFVDSISLVDRAIHNGDVCFTTVRLHQDVMELELLHRARLKLAAERLFLDVNFELLDQTLQCLRQKNGILNGTLKVIISRGDGDRGYAMPEHDADVYVLYYPKSTRISSLNTFRVVC